MGHRNDGTLAKSYSPSLFNLPSGEIAVNTRHGE
jgi:hypothetical protein